MRLPRPVALLLAITAAPLGYAADQVNDVTVKDLVVEPRANLTADDGTLRYHPKVMVGTGYNSNIFAEPNGAENDDFYLRGLVGLEADWRLDPHNNVALNGEFEVLQYADSDNKEGNLVGGLLNADWRWHEAENEATVHAGYARFDDPLIQTGEQILRQTIDGSGTLDLRGATVRTIIAAGATATDYLEDGSGFTEKSRDNTIYRLIGRVGFNTARDTYYYALLGVDRWDYWDNIQYNDSNGITVGLGTKLRIGDRSTLLAEGGVTYRIYEHDFANNAAYNDKQVLAPYLNIMARWPWESGSSVGLDVFSRIDESLTANAAWVYGAVLDGRYRLLARSALFGSLGGYHSEDSGEGQGLANDSRDTFEVAAGVEHEIAKGLVGRLRATYTDSTADVSNDFSRYIVALDFAAAF